MSDKLKKLQIKKLIQEYSYLKTDLEYKFQIIDENKQNFINKISESTEKLGINKVGIVGGSNENPIKENLNNEDVSENVKNKVKKIYREIVKLIHPDKTESNEFIDLYYEATSYSEEYNLLGLYFIC
jgi:DNA-binding transcriptional regulator GbsR (MarR family)